MGKRRFVCLSCHHTFGKPKRTTVTFSDFVTFHAFIKSRRNKVALTEDTGASRTSLWRTFKPFFSYSPRSRDSLFLLEDRNGTADSSSPWVLGLDGKWLHRQGVVMIYRDVINRTNLYWSWHRSESYEAIRSDFEKLMQMIANNLPCAVVSDWKGSIVASVITFLPFALHQRCLAHVQRLLLTFLPLRSPIRATQELRFIAKQITRITSIAQKKRWTVAVHTWMCTYDTMLTERTMSVGTTRSWWYTHGNLRRAVKLLTFTKDHLFAYLTNPLLPATNNSLEGVNSQIKGKLSNHRGMKTPQQVVFIFWLLTFSRVKTKKELKELWDRLKTKICRY